ncbi:MAG TPA: class I SAM-dependent methyltransferase [Vicinamibacterales bacterium]|nr:class I SAM-dependent methyltransferase [Vicinamibacterales bacterium]
MALDHPASSSLENLAARGAAALGDILRLGAHGDWRRRALALSAAGRIARDEPAWKGLLAFGVRRIPSWRRRFGVAGYRGRYVRNRIVDGLFDRSWPVRVAAALSLAEMRSPAGSAQLARMLRAPLRPERLAAAAALLAGGHGLNTSLGSLLEGAAPAPSKIGESADTIEFLKTLAAAHTGVLNNAARTWAAETPGAPRGSDPAAWAAFLAGVAADAPYMGPAAEIERYDAEGETSYLLTKPFSHINHAQNVRLLHSFFVAAEQLEVPFGGRVLDLGGGSGWVSELLATFGYQPFTVDLATSLLTIGQRRFAAKGLTARFIAADMTRLPVASGSMDAVIVMDALHHVPDIPAVFREAARVLVEGGQFILAEPGEGHSEAEKSRAEMIQHGVLEQEIHLFDAVRFGEQSGFQDIRIVPHYVPGIAMSPEQLSAAVEAPADDWMMYQKDQRGHLATYLIQSTFERPILVFRKGRRVTDSRMPRTLKADITANLSRSGSRVRGTATIRNTGDTLWLGGGDTVGHVRVGIQLLNRDRRLLNMEFARVPLAAPVAAGASATVALDLLLPEETTPYVLKIDMVDEGICWFEDAGSTPIYLPMA